MRCGYGGPSQNARKKSGAVLFHHGPRFVEPGSCRSEIFVRYGELFFEFVQFRILENLPPFAFVESISRRSLLPGAALLEICSHGFGSNGLAVLRSNTAGVEQDG